MVNGGQSADVPYGARPSSPEAGPESLVGGVDLGGTQTRVSVELVNGVPRGSDRASTAELASPEGLIAWVRGRVHELGGGAPIASVGIAAPGPLDAGRGIL